MEGMHQSLAGFAERIRQLEYGLQARRRLIAQGVFERIFDAVSDDPDMEHAMIDTDEFQQA
ncbi:hypothetical protein LZK77_01630 [Rhizobium leguminosarum]|nr:hypothetical protein [Rhizobium leguminosarum]MDH6271023.1 hypothetical protein [Rhizobium leguminosarum]UIJ88689.1 hypothetical protein LZK77_01630 [Rhizobium leguminosarum]